MKKIILCAAILVQASVHAARNAEEVMKSSFKDRGQAKVDRLIQDETQAACSKYFAGVPKDAAKRIETANLKTIKYPADGKLVGDWKEGGLPSPVSESSSRTIRRIPLAAIATLAINGGPIRGRERRAS